MREEPDTMEPNTEEQLAYYQRKADELEARWLKVSSLLDAIGKEAYSLKQEKDALESENSTLLVKLTKAEVERDILQAENQSLRSQIVEWREGGAMGADISALDGMLQIVAASRPSGMDLFIEVLTIHRGKEVLFSDSSGDYYNWTWERIDWFCHRSDFPLPVVPRT